MSDLHTDRSGEAIYQKELDEIITRLNAKGVALVVLEGNRNKSSLEFGCGAAPKDIPLLISALEAAAKNLKAQFMEMVLKTAASRNTTTH